MPTACILLHVTRGVGSVIEDKARKRELILPRRHHLLSTLSTLLFDRRLLPPRNLAEDALAGLVLAHVAVSPVGCCHAVVCAQAAELRPSGVRSRDDLRVTCGEVAERGGGGGTGLRCAQARELRWHRNL